MQIASDRSSSSGVASGKRCAGKVPQSVSQCCAPDGEFPARVSEFAATTGAYSEFPARTGKFPARIGEFPARVGGFRVPPVRGPVWALRGPCRRWVVRCGR
eukprot:577154-Prorocentrum_minimum.AAC.1